jgi:hypothetical protein
VLGYLANPNAAREDLAQTAALLGHPVTPQARDQRFPQGLAPCLQRLLGPVCRHAATTPPATAAVLQKFTAVPVQDRTVVSLPDALADFWRGCGTATGKGGAAAVKFPVRLELRSGAWRGREVEAGRVSDQATPLQTADLQPGARHLRDVGYFDREVLRDVAAAGAFSRTRVQDSTKLATADGTPWHRATLARRAGGDGVDQPIRLDARQQLPARLVLARVPPAVAAARRRTLHAKAKKKG